MQISFIHKGESDHRQNYHTIERLVQLASQVMFIRPAYALFLTNSCKHLTLKQTHNTLLGYCRLLEGIAHLLLKNNSDAQSHFQQAKLFFESNTDTDALDWLTIYEAFLAYQLGDFTAASKQLEKAIDSATKSDKKTHLIWCLYYQGEFANQEGYITDALNAYNNALQVDFQVENQSLILFKLHLGLSKAFKKHGDYNLSLTHYENYHNYFRKFYEGLQQSAPETLFFKVIETNQNNQDALYDIFKEIKTYSLLYQSIQDQKDHFKELHDTIKYLERQTHEDSLTKLHNRRHFDEQFSIEFDRSKRHNQIFSLAIADIDHFKKINDNFSHMVGDQVLKEISRLMAQKCRRTDLIARFGGEEFTILLPMTKINKAIIVCERIRKTIETYDWSLIEEQLRVTISIGIVESSEFSSGNDLLQGADNFLYEAKKRGRNRLYSAYDSV